MKKLIKNIILIVILIFIIDYSFGVLFDKIVISSPDGRYYKAYHSLLECEDDIVIIGSSRAETNYAPFVFEDSLKKTCWNAGRGGQVLPFWYAMAEGVLSRYTPEIVILNVEYDFLSYDIKGKSYERAGFLRPFYYMQPVIKPTINKISKFEKLKMMSRIYAYNSSFYYLFRPFLIKNLDGKIEDKGWKTTNERIPSTLENVNVIKSTKELNKQTVFMFDKLINNIKNKGCKIYVVLSPNYNLLVESSPTINYLKTKKDIYLINHSNDVCFSNNSSFYKDKNHLNTKGAIAFSKKISLEIKQNKKSFKLNNENIIYH